MSIEGIAWVQFSETYQETLSLNFHIHTNHDLFHLFLYYHSKQDAYITAVNRKQIMELLKKRKFMGSGITTIWDNIDECAEHYICATALYLLFILLKSYNIVVDCEISAPGHSREVLDGINATEKR